MMHGPINIKFDRSLFKRTIPVFSWKGQGKPQNICLENLCL